MLPFLMETLRCRCLAAAWSGAVWSDRACGSDEVHRIPSCPGGEPFVCVEHKVGVAFHAVPILYCGALAELVAHQGDDAWVAAHAANTTRTLLLTNPDCYTAHNMRCVQSLALHGRP